MPNYSMIMMFVMMMTMRVIMVMIMVTAIVEYLRIWPPSEEGGGEADDVRGGREKKLFCTLDRQT